MTVIVYAPATMSDVISFIETAPGDHGWTVSNRSEAFPQARSLGSITYAGAFEGSDWEVSIDYRDPSGGDQLRLARDFGVGGPWLDVSVTVTPPFPLTPPTKQVTDTSGMNTDEFLAFSLTSAFNDEIAGHLEDDYGTPMNETLNWIATSGFTPVSETQFKSELKYLCAVVSLYGVDHARTIILAIRNSNNSQRRNRLDTEVWAMDSYCGSQGGSEIRYTMLAAD